jgi:hypothetical protein
VDVSAFAVAELHDAYLAVGAATVEAVVWIQASGIDERGVDVSLRLWTPLGATVAALRGVSPPTGDLCDAGVRLDDRTVEYPAGRWRDGACAYELAVALPARRAGDEMLAARFVVAVAGEVVARAPIVVAWTDDRRLITATADGASESTPTAAVAATELPTGLSPQPRHMLVDASPAGEPCPGCRLRPEDGDRFCEACGHELAGGRGR